VKLLDEREEHLAAEQRESDGRISIAMFCRIIYE
jgi:hypothetical protein